MKRTPGTFYNHSTQAEYVALSRVAEVVGVPAYVISDAIYNGTLPVHEVSGCKAITLEDLLRLKSDVAQ